MAQQTSIRVNYLMAGDDTPHAILSQKCILWERGLVKQTSQPWGVSYLINSFLTDIKQLAKTSKGGTLHPPSDVCVRSFLCPFFTLIKLCYTKTLEWSTLVPGPKAKSSYSEITNPTPFTVSYQQHSHCEICPKSVDSLIIDVEGKV